MSTHVLPRIDVAVHCESREQDRTTSSQTNSVCLSVHPGEHVNRDFILRGQLDTTSVQTSLALEPARDHNVARVSAETELQTEAGKHADATGTFAIQIVPPRLDAIVPRDIVFVLDRSGSKGGWKMDAARRGISRLVDSLSPNDRFKLLAFDDRVESPRPLNTRSPHPLTEARDPNRYNTVRWLANIDARGGTEMGRAIQAGLGLFEQTVDVSQPAPRSRSMVRNISVTQSRAACYRRSELAS